MSSLTKSVALWQPEHEVPYNIALNFGRSRFNRVAARTQISVGPLPFIEGVGRPVRQLSVRTENLHRHLLEALVQLAPEDFLDGSLGSRHACFVDAGESTQLIQPPHFDVGVVFDQVLDDRT